MNHYKCAFDTQTFEASTIHHQVIVRSRRSVNWGSAYFSLDTYKLQKPNSIYTQMRQTDDILKVEPTKKRYRADGPNCNFGKNTTFLRKRTQRRNGISIRQAKLLYIWTHTAESRQNMFSSRDD